ncbi:MAG: DNA repair protein RecO [Lentisphaeria bacterium]|nr:DNA repair protein RecO [Lentisphaeria bacterium]
MIISCQFIMLDRRPYRESALIASGISPDYGKVSFVLHGAQKVSEKNFPVADLFRELEIEFNDDGNPKELYTAKSVELLSSFDNIANDSRSFKMAGRIASFLLKNSPPNLPQPYTYDSLRSVLANLAQLDCGHDHWTLEQCAVVIKSAYLCENGLLPETQNEKQNDFLENLVASGIDNSPLPDCNPKYWSMLNNWLNSLIEFHHLKR